MAAVALAVLMAYMFAVGLNKASLIATAGSFFVTIAGIAVTLIPRPSAEPAGSVRVRQTIYRTTVGGSATQAADVPPGGDVSQDMVDVTSRNGAAHQDVRVSGRPPVQDGHGPGAGDA